MNVLEQIISIANDGQATDRLGDIVKLAREYLDSENMPSFPEAGERLWIVPGTMTTEQSESNTGEQAGSKVLGGCLHCDGGVPRFDDGFHRSLGWEIPCPHVLRPCDFFDAPCWCQMVGVAQGNCAEANVKMRNVRQPSKDR